MDFLLVIEMVYAHINKTVHAQWLTHLPHNAHISHTVSVPLTHSLESLNRDIQDRAIITRQMNTWRQSALSGGGASDGGNDL